MRSAKLWVLFWKENEMWKKIERKAAALNQTDE